MYGRQLAIIGSLLLFGGCAEEPEAGGSCADDSGVSEVCTDGKVLDCEDGVWVEDPYCTCDGLVTECATPGFTGLTRARTAGMLLLAATLPACGVEAGKHCGEDGIRVCGDDAVFECVDEAWEERDDCFCDREMVFCTTARREVEGVERA